MFCLCIPKSDHSSVGTAYSTVSFVIHIFIQNFVSSSYYCSCYNYFHYNFLDYQNSHITATAATVTTASIN